VGISDPNHNTIVDYFFIFEEDTETPLPSPMLGCAPETPGTSWRFKAFN
jgi:hypothetical protein